MSHCLFLFLLLRVGSFRRFQVVSDDARWGGAAGKGTCRSFHNEGCSTSCIHRLRRFGKSCTTSFLSLNYFCRSHGALAGYSEACVEGTRYPAFHSYNKPPLSIRSNHTTRDANQDHGAVGTGNDATWNREDCGLWSCDGGSAGTQVQGWGFQTTSLCSTNLVSEPQQSSPRRLEKQS